MHNPSLEQIQQFTGLYLANRGNAVRACMAMGMSRKNAKANAWLYKQKAQVPIQDALRAAGLDEVTTAQEWAKLVRSRSEDIKLRALREVSKIFGLYPGPESTHVGDNVTVIWNVDTNPTGRRERTLDI